LWCRRRELIGVEVDQFLPPQASGEQDVDDGSITQWPASLVGADF
jgi:hypothetical protein